MGYLDEDGRNGGRWYGAQYPLGATRYYRTAAAREAAISRYTAAIRATGGEVWRIDNG